jgi:hypothetical protein
MCDYGRGDGFAGVGGMGLSNTNDASSVQKMPSPYANDTVESDKFDNDWAEGDDVKIIKDEPVHRLRYEFLLLLEHMDLDFGVKYNLMRAIDDILERHGLEDD